MRVGRAKALRTAARAQALRVVGAVPLTPADGLPGMGSLWLLAPDGARFWPAFTASPEARDRRPDPMDRWSARVIGAVAEGMGGTAVFPFGLPHRPFYAWALRSGRFHPSPVHLLVHRRMGLWASFRGAIALPDPVTARPQPSPCTRCPAPCTAACPPGALTTAGYDTATCHAFLDSPAGGDCMARGCAVRRACPAGKSYGRLPPQSAWHMRQFHP